MEHEKTGRKPPGFVLDFLRIPARNFRLFRKVFRQAQIGVSENPDQDSEGAASVVASASSVSSSSIPP